MAAQPGGVILIEQAEPFFVGSNKADILIEFDPEVQKAIRIATFFGVTVVEPSGNARVNFDAFPFMAHVQPGNPAFVDSRAIVVAAGSPQGSVLAPTWQRGFTSFGARVDCFASGIGVRAPSLSPNIYENFGGSSSASAIVAGVVAAMQGMAIAATGQPLFPTDIRTILRNPDLGTPTTAGLPGGIGVMPDLRKIARHKRWIRALPVSGAATGPDTMTLVHLDDDDRLVRRNWKPDTFFGDPIPFDPSDASFTASPQQVAVVVTNKRSPPRDVTDMVMTGHEGSLHVAFATSLGEVGLLSPERAPAHSVAEGRDLAAVRPTIDTLVVMAVASTGELVAFAGDATDDVANGFGPAFPVDPVASFRRCAGAALVSPSDDQMVAFAVDDGGNPHFYSGSAFLQIATLWTPLPVPSSSVVLDPTARSSLAAVPGGLVALAVGTDGFLHSCAIGVLPPTFEAFAPVDASVTVAATAPVSIVLSGSTLFAIAVSEFGFLQFATRPVGAGQTWSPLIPIDPLEPVSLLGGATAFALGSSVAVLAVLRDGRPCWSRFDSATGWEPLRAA